MSDGSDQHSENNFFARYVRQIVFALATICAFLAYFFPSQIWFLVPGFAFAGYLIHSAAIEPSSRSVAPAVRRQKSVSGLPVFMTTEALQFPTYVLDQQGVVHHANESAAEVFGRKRVGERITIMFRQPELNSTINAALKTGEPVQTMYLETVPSERWFSVGISPIPFERNRGEAGPFFVLCFHDLTEAKRTDRMRSDFIANASHELRTPLASLLGYIETLKGPAKNDRKSREKFLDVMLDQAERMSRLVNDLLSLSKIEMKAHVRPSDQLDVSLVLSEVVQSLEGLAKQMNVKISSELEPNIWIVGDRDELVQVFENLIENACKYGQEGGKVNVNLKRIQHDGTEFAEASVIDYGPGIAEENLQRITERFYRVDVARSREKQGTGLGLAIVKHILNRHKTRLEIESEPGDGAVFRVKLPLIDVVKN